MTGGRDHPGPSSSASPRQDRRAPPEVAILLSAYNGAAFLPEQLASLEAQDGVRWRLFWRDDGSTDDSVAILRRFAAGHPSCQEVVVDEHLGVTGSYMALLRRAVAEGAGPIAFADQDDVWLPRKLARGLSLLGAGATPVLYCSRQLLVDRHMRPLGLSEPIMVPPGLCPALTQNIATGCTVMLNAAAAALVAGSHPPMTTLHDWWSYLVVTAAGGAVVADEQANVRYRQHPANAVGAPPSRRRRAIAALRRGPALYMGVLRAHVRALREQPELLSAEGAATVEAVGGALERRAVAGALARLAVLRRFGLLRQTRAETWLFRTWFLLG